MATKLYFHAASHTLSGSFPAGEQSPTYTPGFTFTNANTLRKMDTTIGTAQSSLTGTSAASTTAQIVFMGFWVSQPLLGPQTFGGTTWTLNIADAESNLSMNFWMKGCHIYVWRPSAGSRIVSIVENNNIGGTEVTASASEQVTTFTFTPTSTTAQDGDVIICELWATFTQATATAYTGTIYFDGTTENATENTVVSNHASFLNIAENLVFQGNQLRDPFGNMGFFHL